MKRLPDLITVREVQVVYIKKTVHVGDVEDILRNELVGDILTSEIPVVLEVPTMIQTGNHCVGHSRVGYPVSREGLGRS